jgi:hypothetical protein
MRYEYKCSDEACTSFGKIVDVSKPMQESSRREYCPTCLKEMDRVYSSARTPEFWSFWDEQYGCEISSRKQEERLMRKHGHIYTRDSKWIRDPKYKQLSDKAKWKQGKVLV